MIPGHSYDFAFGSSPRWEEFQPKSHRDDDDEPYSSKYDYGHRYDEDDDW